jgi:glutathione S-transferase
MHIPVNPLKPKATIGHTNGAQVPVLEVGGEWRRESSNHARWLDDLFHEKPLYPLEHRAKVDEIDRWISDKYLTSLFRRAIDGGLNSQFLNRGWRLATLVNAQMPIPLPIRFMWSLVLRMAPFIRHMAKHMDLTENYDDMHARIMSEFVAHIDDGPYVCGLDQPAMLDLAVSPNLVFGYMYGFEDNLSAAIHPAIKDWLKHVSEHLPSNPTLAPDKLQIHSLTKALA